MLRSKAKRPTYGKFFCNVWFLVRHSVFEMAAAFYVGTWQTRAGTCLAGAGVLGCRGTHGSRSIWRVQAKNLIEEEKVCVFRRESTEVGCSGFPTAGKQARWAA